MVISGSELILKVANTNKYGKTSLMADEHVRTLVPAQRELHNASNGNLRLSCSRILTQRSSVSAFQDSCHLHSMIFIFGAIGDTTALCCLVSSPDSWALLCRHQADFPNHSGGPRRKPPPTGSTAGTLLLLASGALRCPPHRSHALSAPLRISGPVLVGCQSVRGKSCYSRQMA